MTEDETVGWHHQLNGHEFEQTLGVGEGQGLQLWRAEATLQGWCASFSLQWLLMLQAPALGHTVAEQGVSADLKHLLSLLF